MANFDSALDDLLGATAETAPKKLAKPAKPAASFDEALDTLIAAPAPSQAAPAAPPQAAPTDPYTVGRRFTDPSARVTPGGMASGLWGMAKQGASDIGDVAMAIPRALYWGATDVRGTPQAAEHQRRLFESAGKFAEVASMVPEARGFRAGQEALAPKITADVGKLGPPDEVAARLGAPRGPQPSPVDVGQQVVKDVQAKYAEAAPLPGKIREEAFAQPGAVPARGFEGYGTRLRGRLGEDPQNIVDATTPQADQALNYLDAEISKFKITNKVGPQMPAHMREEITGIDLRGLNQVRKNLTDRFLARAKSPEDARIMGEIIKDFDKQVEKGIADPLFSGDPKALQMLKYARGVDKKLTSTFEQGGLARQIVDNKVGPDQVANALFGLNKVGMTKMATDFWKDAKILLKPETIDNYRLSLWDQYRGKPAELRNMLDSSIGREMFTPGERQLMLESLAQPASERAKEMVLNALAHTVETGMRYAAWARHPLRRTVGVAGSRIMRDVMRGKPTYGGVE